ncbi:hypothetical protein CCR80_06225 [Rhodothalassium salexigens]|uniref:glycosyltransferase family 2 protein n=1 Tax=Rhodothalassium salexigens TaxID=1086 RepID=UPI0019128599|nr:glycosyltransferase family A protein [Rhodothalassium salexigens]MBK5920633.1 hypothetical protein [Rhodothalassium salexigens]
MITTDPEAAGLADPVAPTEQPRWSVVIPYYNETAFLEATLRSLIAQTFRPFVLILVDNGSDDGSPDLARRVLDVAEKTGIFVSHYQEDRPGQVHALETGIAAVTTEFVAICDADTLYPPDYLATADRAFAQADADVVAVHAHGLTTGPETLRGKLAKTKRTLVAHLWPDQCHTGGYAHTFRTAALKAAGGYSKALWPYVVKDHEMMHRVLKQGRAVYPWPLWCQASDRRANRRSVRWTLVERLIYHFSPRRSKDWFFYTFLARRFARRQCNDTNLRRRDWVSHS